jgi:hypothetical protein
LANSLVASQVHRPLQRVVLVFSFLLVIVTPFLLVVPDFAFSPILMAFVIINLLLVQAMVVFRQLVQYQVSSGLQISIYDLKITGKLKMSFTYGIKQYKSFIHYLQRVGH